jgi:hypothetical protein
METHLASHTIADVNKLASWGLKLTTGVQVPGLRGTVPPLPHMSSWCAQRDFP